MSRKLQFMVSSLAIFAALGLSAPQQSFALDMVWDGGDGLWDDANWNDQQGPDAVLGVIDGADGWGGPLSEEGEMENVIISGPGSIVEYDADGLSADFEFRQGATLTVSDGAVWQQLSNDDWGENRWTEFDGSALTLDGGTFRRVGAVREEGGGALIFGSWQGDDNFDEPDSTDHFRLDMSITNGGLFENEGQLWIGGWNDGPDAYDWFEDPSQGFTVNIEINDGVMDLTGGDVSLVDNEDYWADGDLVFTNRWSFPDNNFGDGTYVQPEYAVNFTGPGSIVVDRTGIVNTFKDENGEWQNLDPVSYQDLWDAGILQANGVSGPDGADFATFFSVTGMVGQDDYTLTSLVGAGIAGDFNNNGILDAEDIDLLSAEVTSGMNPPAFDLNEDGLVNGDDRDVWVEGLANTYYGDADLNGTFDSGDFVAVFQQGEYEDGVAGNSGWGSGDWNGDTEFDSGDFVEAFQAGGYELGPRGAVSAVPEPGSLTLLCLAGLSLLGFRRR